MKLKQRVMKKVSKPIKNYFKDKERENIGDIFWDLTYKDNPEYTKAYDNFCKTIEELKKEKN